MYKEYFHDIADHFLNLRPEQIPEEVLVFIRRSLLNYAGGTLYAASHDCCRSLLDFFKVFHPGTGKSLVWGDTERVLPVTAAFCNAARISTLELNDGAGSSAHPGIYVWSGIFATLQEHGGTTGDVLRAVLFGFETAARMSKLSINRVIELGLHNPGFVGGLGTASAVGLLCGLTLDQLDNAFGMTASLIPLCPFVSFIEGSDTKDFYGGWGTYIGMMAVDAAGSGLTGPKGVLQGMKSLDQIFQGETGSDIPLGVPYAITGLGVKQYPACFAVNPAVNAVLALRREHDIRPEDVEKLVLETYPYSYDLNAEIGNNINRTSGKLSLPYTAAVALRDGELFADAFLDNSLRNETVWNLMDRIEVHRHDAYGEGDSALRACTAEIILKDGSVFRHEYNASEHKIVWNKEMLRDRYFAQVGSALSVDDAEQLYHAIDGLSCDSDLIEIMDLMSRVRRV